MAHNQVSEEVAEKVKQHVLDGMGLIVLHSGHLSKPFVKLMGTCCRLKWRENDETERIWVVEPAHPIASGLPEYIEFRRKKPTASVLKFLLPTSLCSSAGSRAVKCSEADVATNAVWAKFSTSVRVTRDTPSTGAKILQKFLKTRYTGQNRATVPNPHSVIMTLSKTLKTNSPVWTNL